MPLLAWAWAVQQCEVGPTRTGAMGCAGEWGLETQPRSDGRDQFTEAGTQLSVQPGHSHQASLWTTSQNLKEEICMKMTSNSYFLWRVSTFFFHLVSYGFFPLHSRPMCQLPILSYLINSHLPPHPSLRGPSPILPFLFFLFFQYPQYRWFSVFNVYMEIFGSDIWWN